jgi:hypothetical protein
MLLPIAIKILYNHLIEMKRLNRVLRAIVLKSAMWL